MQSPIDFKNDSPDALLQSVNAELKAQGLLKEKLFSLGKKQCAGLAASATEAPDTAFEMPPLEELLGQTPEQEASFLYRLALDPDFRSRVLRERTLGASSSMGDWLSPPPANIRESVLRRLFQEGYFGRRREDLPIGRKPVAAKKQGRERIYDPKLEAVAYFMIRSLNSADAVETYLPGMGLGEFQRLQSVVNRAIDQFLPEKALKFKAFLNDSRLKPPQKEAFVAVYLQNESGLSQEQIAENRRIPLGTLQARLKSAKEVLKKHFREWEPKADRQVQQQPTPATDLRDAGLLRFSSCEKIAPIRHLNPQQRRIIEKETPGREIPYSQLMKTPQKGFAEQWKRYQQSWYEPLTDIQVAPLRRRKRLEYPRSRRSVDDSA